MSRAIFAAACVLVVTATMAADFMIDNGPSGSIAFVGGANGSDIYGQSFISPETAKLVAMGMWLLSPNEDDDPPLVGIELWDDDGTNHPDETNQLVTGTTHQGFLAQLTRIDAPGNGFLLQPGHRYWVVINGLLDQTSTGNYQSTHTPTDSVPDGGMDWSNDLGATWSGGGQDSDFGVFVNAVSLIPLPAAVWMALPLLASLGAMSVIRSRRRGSAAKERTIR